MSLTDIYKPFHPHSKNYTFFSEPQGISSKTDQMLGYKASLKRHKKTEITPCILSDHHRLKLDSNRNNRNLTNSWKLKKIITE